MPTASPTAEPLAADHRQEVFDAPFCVIAGPGEAIRALLFGPLPSPRDRALAALRLSWSTRRRVQGIVHTFPNAFRRFPNPLATNDRAVRRAIAALRSAAA